MTLLNEPALGDLLAAEAGGSPDPALSQLDLPTDRPRPAGRPSRNAEVGTSLSAAAAAAAHRLARQAGVSPLLVLQAAFQALLHRWSGADDGLSATSFLAIVERMRRASLGQPAAAHPDLALACAEEGDGFSVSLEYAADLFFRSTAERLLTHCANLLVSAAEEPGRPLTELRLIDAAEERLLRVGLNRSETGYALPVAVHDLFTRQAEQTPDKAAAGVLTYRRLGDSAAALAARIQEVTGARLDRRIGLLADPGPRLLTGMLGILESGGGFVPLDPRSPDERLAWMLEDSACEALVTEERHLARAVRLSRLDPRRIFCLDDAAAQELGREAAARAVERPRDPRELRSLAYIVYTSGSTGRPKGVQIAHESLVPMLLWGRDYLGLGEHTRVLQSLSFLFDFGIFELLTTVIAGGTLSFPGEAAGDPAAFAEEILRHGINTLHTTPAFARELAALEPAGGGLSGLEIIHLGGEALSRSTVARLREAAPRAALYNGYGPTEATINSSIFRIGRVGRIGDETEDAGWPVVPIGRRSADNALYVLDRDGRLVPLGARGELHVGGIGVARGYLNRPRLTAERFIPDPYGTTPGGRLYRTGDLVRYLPGGGACGDLEFLGRIDQQVKVRGFRVEPGEIEAVLREHPAVREAVVIARPEPAGNLRLVAYVVAPAGDGEESGDPLPALRAFLGERLPPHMVPSAFVSLASLPLTPNGKLDRKALPEPGWSGAGAHGAEAAPRTPKEELLAGFWAQLLDLPSVGIFDNFFDLGGHSLLGARLVARVRRALGIELPLRALFEAPTVAALAAWIDTAGGLQAAAPPVVATGLTAAPLSYAQESLWLLDQFQPGSAVYNIGLVLRLTGELDIAALRSSFTEIVRRHGALRTIFVETNGDLLQVVAPAGPVALPVLDLTGLPPSVHEREAGRLIEEEAGRPFDLARGPLLRLRLFHGGAGDHTLVTTIHHIASDGWSMGILEREISVLYQAFAAGLPSPLPELPVQYVDFTLWQRRLLTGPVLQAHVDFWRRELAGAPAQLELPTDRPRPAVQTYRGATIAMPPPAVLAVSAGVADAVRALARRAGATPFMVLLTVFQSLLHRWSGTESVLVGSPVANRGRVELEELIGILINTLVFPLRLDRREESFLSILERVRVTTLACRDHQDLPFELLVDELGVERSLSLPPLFQTMLVLHNTPPGALRLPGLTFTLLEAPNSTSKLDLTLICQETSDGFAVALEHSTDLFDRATMERFLGHFTTLLASAAAAPELPLAELRLMDAVEERLLRSDLNDLKRGESSGAPPVAVHDLFAHQVERAPGQAAAVGAAGEMTYRELSERAAALASWLGPRLDACVGLLADPAPDVLVGMLGILAAGGGFVPLDPRSPDERLAWMLEDSGCAVLVTQKRHLARLRKLAGGAAREIFCLDDETDLRPGAQVAARPRDPRELRSLAYIVYTSGSTGRPKGVQIAHESLVPMLLWGRDYFGLGGSTRVLQSLSFVFDFGIFEHLTTVISGGTLYFPGEAAGDPAAFAREIARHRINTLHTTPAFARELAAQGDALDNLEIVHLGGEALEWSTVARLREMAPRAAVYNGYGPTEATVNSSIYRVGPAGESTGWPVVPIGRRSADNALYVLDPGDSAARLVPFGVRGELCVGGPGVARGYLGRPELTAERFVPDPFGATPGGRLYRTGDLVRHLRDGNLEFLGRIDQQVKIRGFRVEPGEIEATLREHPGVREAAVIARPEPSGSLRLVAYVVADAGAPDLRAFLAERLPPHMVPAAFVPLASLPLTASGKLDRRALPEPAATPVAAAASTGAAPRTPLEELLAGFWTQLLDLPRVGICESFFALGGHSLLGARLVTRVRQALGVELPLRALFEAPTIAGLAAWIDAARGNRALEAPSIVPGGACEAPLSFAQERLWFLDRLQPDSSFYNIPAIFRLTGALDVAALRDSFSEIVRRHGALRTVFREADGEARQLVTPAEPVALPLVDLAGLPAPDRESETARLIAREAGRPFDLARGPVLRLHLLRAGAGDHVLIANVHHIASDGWSMGVLGRELTALYEALTRGLTSPLPEPPVQYIDFSLWQRRWLSGPVLAAQLDFWRRELAGAPILLELPTDRPRPPVQSYRGATVTAALPAAAAAAVHTLARQAGATPFMVLLAAFQTLLHRWSGADDVLVGSPVANRSRVEVEGLIGVFINTLVFPLRLRRSGDESFLAALAGVRATTLAGHDHQDLPFELLVEELAVERSLAYTPLFQTMLVLQNAPAGELRLPGLTFSPLEAPGTTAKLDLSLVCTQADGEAGSETGFTVALEHATDLFDRATAERFLSHFASLLADAAADPGKPLSALRLMDAAEERLLRVDRNRAERSYALPVAVQDLFARQAERTPGKAAAVGSRGEVTYRQLGERAAALAARIRSLPAGAAEKKEEIVLDRRIGLLSDPDPQVLVGMLGILAAGAAFVPLDPRSPEERLAWMLEDSACAVLVTQERHLEQARRLAGGRREVLCLDDEMVPPAGPIAEPPRDPRELLSLAYIVYTSGSTGTPKGVQIAHESLVPMLLWGCGYLGLGEETRALQSLSHFFDFGIFEVLTTVICGGTLHFPGEAAGDPAAFARVIRDHGINTLHTTPAFARELADQKGALDSLRIIHLGGEALSWSTVVRLREAAPRAALYNGYGPTEATVNSSIFAIVGEGEASWPVVPIGRRSADNTLYIVDRKGGLAPLGVSGELCVGGIGVARGYLNRPEMTAERFVPDPFAASPGGRLYRTGDLVRYLPDGEIAFLGRIDQQVKVRGFRIEPGEIEAALREHPAVREAAVIALPEVSGNLRLAAYVVAGEGGKAEPAVALSDLRSFLARRLPPHMVPAAFAFLPSLPLTANGKLDRRALEAIAPTDATTSGSAVDREAATPVRELLTQVWCDVLGLAAVDPRDSFFHLGGHSLLAARVLARVREVFKVDIPLREMFQRPTIEGIEAAIREARWGDDPLLPPALAPVPRAGGLPLSFVQEALWFIHLLNPAATVYNIAFAWRLSGPLDAIALAAGLSAVARRHEALRTRFREIDGEGSEPVQEILPAASMPLPRVDLSGLPETARQAEIARRARAETGEPFDLRAGPLARAVLAILAPEEHALLLTVHHAVFDGLSAEILGRELAALYAAALSGEPAALPALPIQYADFAAWQRCWLTGDVLEQMVAWWRGELAGAPLILELPTDRPRRQAPTFRGALESLVLPEPLAQAVRALARRAGVTPFMAILATFQLLLHRHAGQTDVLVGSPVADRPRPELEGLIGYFVNSLVLRGRFEQGSATVLDLLALTRETTLGAFTHQSLPFDRLVAELQIERDLSRNPLFQVMLALETPGAGLSLPGLAVEPVDLVAHALSMFDLTLTLSAAEGSFTGSLEYSVDLFDRATARRLLERFAALLEMLTADPAARLDTLSLLSAAEIAELRAEADRFIGPLGQQRAGALLPELFAAQAARTARATALLTQAGEAVTYADLDRRSNALARTLRRRGVGPEVPVGVCLERSPELVIALLGILKAGGVYLPLDPAYPADRLAFMLADSAAPLVLSTSRLAVALPTDGPAVLALDLAEPPAAEPAPLATTAVDGENLAYLIYTSGSTGKPKGVGIAHRRAAEHMEIAAELWALRPGDRVLLFSSPSFDISLEEMLPPLISGATVVIRSGELWSPSEVLDKVSELGISVLDLPTAYWHQWAADTSESAATAALPPAFPLRLVVLGGEGMSGELARRWSRTPLAGIRLLNAYGPTEAIITSTALEIDRAAAEAAGGVVPIGYSLQGRSCWVLGAYDQVAADGAAGELCLGGPLLARGYLGRPDLTAERFVPDPFAAVPGARLYRTGDRVRRRLDGILEFLGRIDRQVKVRGFRIELGEVESALARHPAVREAVADIRRDSSGNQILVAWIVPPAETVAPAWSEMRDFLRVSLPEHMVPAAVVALPELPLTPNGKVDRRALPEPAVERTEAADGDLPRDPVAEIVAGIWTEILGLDRIGSHESFFQLGGHSLQATRLMAMLRRTFGIDMPLSDLFEAPTVAGLAARVRAALETKEQASFLPAVPVPRRGALPLSFAQQRLWLVETMQPAGATYNIPFALRLAGPFGPREHAALAWSLGEVVRRHESLRTRIVERDSELFQDIRAAGEPDRMGGAALPTVDLAGLPPERRAAEQERTGRQEAGRAFALTAEPLLRVFLWRLGEEEHALFVNQHHIVSDGWSVDIYLRDLRAFYAAALALEEKGEGTPASLPGLPIQYADYAVWQRRWLSGGALGEQLGHWRERLAGTPALELPLDFSRPAVQTFRGAVRSLPLPPALVSGLRALSRSENATTFMLLLAGLQGLLGRFASQDDFAIGVPIANRDRPEVEHLIGFFVNMVALRADLSGAPTFRRLLGRVRATTQDAFAHHDVPFERLVEELAPERDLSLNPIFQVSFQLLLADQPPAFPGLSTHLESLASGTAKFDLAWQAEESGDDLEVFCEYSTDLLEDVTAQRMVEHFATLLAAAVEAPDRVLRELPLWNAAQRHQVLLEWNDTRELSSPLSVLHELIAAQARRAPEAPAVVWRGGTLSYSRLDARADRLAAELRALGVGPDVRVGVCLERSPELILSLLAVHKAGGAYVALDPANPEERLAFQIEDSRTGVLLIRPGRVADLAAERGVRCLLPREEDGDIAAGDAPGPLAAPHLQDDHLAYVIYTSGSTGDPKGVEVSHRSLRNLIGWYIRSFGLTAADRGSLTGAVGFDASVWEIWPFLAVGASLHIVPEEDRTALERLRDWIVAAGITICWQPILLAEALIDLPWPSEIALRVILTGGDRLRARPPRSLPFSLRLAYGPAEGTVICTQTTVPAEGPRGGRAPAIGRPFANVGVLVVDRWLQPVPPGVPGELLIVGAGVSRGYLRRPALTAERFIPDPLHSLGGGSRAYRTGDLVRFLGTGEVEFLGRIDHQVKIRGYRVELGEIEAALKRHPEVREAAVLPVNSSLVAYFTSAARLDSADLTAFLGRTLPDYMVPALFVPLPDLPLNASGKVDRRALAALRPSGVMNGVMDGGPAGPLNPIEELIIALWEEALGRSPIHPRDNFFHLGGHSLLATRVLSRIREAYAVDLPVQALFAAPTVSGLARAVAAARRGTLDGAMPPLRPAASRIGPLPLSFPLSFPQQRLWFVDRLAPDGGTYNIPAAFVLRGELDPAALAAGLDAVVARHETLRTRFVEVDGRPWQEILPPAPIGPPLVDLGGLPAERRAGELARIGREDAFRPFDLRRAPLLRVTLVRLAAEEHAFFLTVHHIVSDGWSEEILFQELSAFYTAAREGRLPPLRPLRIQYADFAVWQRAWPEEMVAEQLAYWTEKLRGVATLEVPTDRPRPPVQTFRGGVVVFTVPARLAAALRALARERRVTQFMLLLAAWQTLFHHVTGQDDVAVGSPVANRTRPELERLIGFFINMLPLRTDFGRRETDGGRPAFTEVLERVRQVALAAYDHADVPFERLVDELHLERDLSRQPLVQVMFTQQSGEAETLRLPGLEATPLDLTGSIAKFDLTLNLADAEAGLHGLIEYNSDLFDATTVARLGQHLFSVFEAVAGDPAVRVAEIDLLRPAERQQLLREWNDTRAPFPAERLMHQSFEARADRAPGAVAALWAGEMLTYGGLEARANRIAALLRRRGVRRGTPVGVWMERSLDMLAAVLGILKAGGYYVPLDPAWPAERVETILADTASPVILTRSAHLGPVLELRWRLPALADVICLDVDTAAPAPEPVDTEGLRAVFDLVAERAVDRATAGGFISSFTGEPFSEAEVDEYRDRVVALATPRLGADPEEKRVLEIGSGSGLILWEIAPRVRSYTGLDPSPVTQERNRARAAELGLANVELPVGFAHETGSWPEGSFDLVILASTAQFFPGPLYLEHVIAGALRLLAPGGTLLIADVPDARRQEELRRAVQEHREGGVPRQDQRKILSLDEDLFRDLAAALPALLVVEEVSIHHRETGFANELRFRYDVVLTRNPAAALDQQVEPGTATRRKHLWTSWHVERAPAERLAPVTSPDDLAYVIHTSGSTGQPKGILVQHRPVANLVDWINRSFGIGPADRVLFVTSLCFDLSVWDIFGVLAAGGSVHVASEEELRDPEQLVRMLLAEPITVWDSAPAALVRLAPLFPARPATQARLRRVMLSGDWIPVSLPDRVRAAFPGVEVFSLGGATEATVWSNWYPVRAVDPSWPSIPYGRPIANARYHVLDAILTPRPMGVPGDLYIGGEVLCLGYAHQPDLTAASFLPDPFSAEPGARIYRTGDRARHFTDGNLEFLGRVDDQVKIRGFRIELGEIEVALARHPGVREAVVLAREDVPGDKRLVAYVVPPPGEAAPGAAELRELLRHGLPEYMLPAAYVELSALPVTPNGKLDRRALPVPRFDHAASAETALPATSTEEALAAVWRDILGVEHIGRFDNFFDLGGHSLLATQLVARLRGAFHTEVALRTIFQSPVLADLAAALDAEIAARAASPLSPVAAVPEIQPIPRDVPGLELPLSASQLRQWFVVQLEPESPAYNLPINLRLDGELEPAAFAAALREIVRRHEALRTAFVAVGGRPAAVLFPEVFLPLPLADLRALPGSARETEARRLAAADLARPFDLTRGPLLRVMLLRLSPAQTPGEHLLVGTFHHIVFDGFSLGIFLRELATLYEAFAAGRPSPLPELPVQYVDYAAWQQRWLASPEADAAIAHWNGRLEGASPVLHLPTDRPRPAVQTHNGDLFQLDVPAGLGGALKRLSGREGVTLFMVLLAGYAAVLSRYSGQDDFNVGTYVANRRREVLERLIGFFVNTVVLRMDLKGSLTGGLTFRELLVRLRDTTLDAFEHQEIPFERLLDELEIERDLSRTPLFQVLFGVQNFAVPTLQAGGVTMLPAGSDEDDRTNYEIAYWMWEEDGDLNGWVQYSTDLFDRATMVRLFRHMATLLAAGAADPGRRLAELPLLPEEERRQILDTWSGSGREERRSQPLVHERMREQALRTPAAPAVVAGERILTYGDLDLQASRVARGLRRLGAGPETVVGLCIDRSPEMIVALYGILGAGAAYLPLDPALPAERLALLLADAGAPVVLSRRGLALPELPVRVLRVEDDFNDTDLTAEGGETLPESAAYVLYTSGSTGAPKGVIVEHRALASFVAAALETYAIGSHDRVLQFASLSFDTSAEEIYPCLAAGGTLVLRGEEMIASPARFLEGCRAAGITVLDLPTAYWHELASSSSVMLPQALPPALRLIILGGERALPERVRAWLAATGGQPRLFNTYGPTEGTVVATACDLAATAPAVPIGRPLRGVEIYLLDRELRPAPTGVPGEICLGGADLARGYLGRPDLTAERFVPSPFGGPGERVYRTGDLGRWLPDGEIDFVGRADDQVKIRGFRIEPGEVAATLARHPQVREAVVVAHSVGVGAGDGEGERRLAAYAVTAEPRPSIADLRAFLKDRLPAYMVPADIVLLDAMPLTRTGKVDRRALPAVDAAGGSARDEGYAPPETATEEMLAEIWQQLLGRERIGIYDNFFDLGGHSLLVPQLISRIGDAFLIELPLRALFEVPTIAQMATVIEEMLLAQIEELSDEEAASLIGEP